MSKGFLILGIIVMAFFQNAVKIIAFFHGEKAEPVVLVPIYYYTLFILLLTGALLLFFKRQNKKVNNKSSMLMVEAESAKVDGILTLATGLVFFLISFIPVGSAIDFFLYIGDSIIVIAISLVMIGSPLKIIKNAFIELGGGTLQNKQEKQEIEHIIRNAVKDAFSFEAYITKVGSGYMVVVYVEPEKEGGSITQYKLIQAKIKHKLKEHFPVIFVEIALKDLKLNFLMYVNK